MENGPDGQVEEPLLFMERSVAETEKGMAVLFEQIEKTLPSIINPGFNIREMKLVSLVFFEDFLKGNWARKSPRIISSIFRSRSRWAFRSMFTSFYISI